LTEYVRTDVRCRLNAMARRPTNTGKVTVAVGCGLLVGVIAGAVHLAIMPRDPATMQQWIVGDLIAALTAIIVCLGIQLKQEEVHYRTAMERAAIVAELNHHVRNAVFPLCLAVQKSGDSDALKAANDAVDRINIALKDATADAFSGRVEYSGENGDITAG